MYRNVASQKLVVFAFDATTNSPKTGDAANITAYVSKDYGTITVLGDTSATEMDSANAKGYYLFDLTQSETDAICLTFSAKSSSSNIVVVGAPAVVFTDPNLYTTGQLALEASLQGLITTIGSGAVNVATAVWSMLTSTFSFTVAGSVGKLLKDNVDAAISSRATPTNITAGTITTVTTVTNRVTANVDQLAGDATAATNLSKSTLSIYVGAVTGVATTTTLIDSGLTQTDVDFWKGRIVIFITGSLAKQATDITAFDPTTDKLTFTALTAAPSAADAYVVI